jgi:hypothetical protein
VELLVEAVVVDDRAGQIAGGEHGQRRRGLVLLGGGDNVQEQGQDVVQARICAEALHNGFARLLFAAVQDVANDAHKLNVLARYWRDVLRQHHDGRRPCVPEPSHCAASACGGGRTRALRGRVFRQGRLHAVHCQPVRMHSQIFGHHDRRRAPRRERDGLAPSFLRASRPVQRLHAHTRLTCPHPPPSPRRSRTSRTGTPSSAMAARTSSPNSVSARPLCRAMARLVCT